MKKVWILLILSAIWGVDAQAQDAATVLQRMHQEIKEAENFSFRSKIWERLNDGTTQYSAMDTKLQPSPFTIYVKNLVPKDNAGVEVLYNKATDNRKMLVNPNGPPYFNIKLGLNSNRVRGMKKHHSMEEAGFTYLTQIIASAEKRARDEGRYDEVFVNKGNKVWEGISCHQIEVNDPTYHITDYTVQSGENLIGIARKLAISEYKILMLNPDIDSYWSVKAGQKIKIPSSYSKRNTIYVTKDTYMPVVVLIYDDKGLFERYEYHNLEINQVSPAEFTSDYEGYGF